MGEGNVAHARAGEARLRERVPVAERLEGVRLLPLALHGDERGSLVELYRREWLAEPIPRQWNAVWSGANVLRGVHVHLRHYDYLICLGGRMLVGLADLRRGCPSRGCAALAELRSETPAALVIPPGVAHGFYFPARGAFVYGVDRYFDPADELACRWDDPELEIPWPEIDPLLSPRDARAGSLRELIARNDALAMPSRGA